MQQGPFAPRALPRFNAVGSEGAHRSADPRPPLKPDIQFSRIRLSQRLDYSSRLDGRNQEDKAYEAHLIVELTLRELLPPPTAPAFEPMRPDTSQDPTIETREELADVSFMIVKTPTANNRVDLVD